MFNALSIGATGMQAQQMNVETIANNLTNSNTPGFKKSRVHFADLVVQNLSRQNTQASDEYQDIEKQHDLNIASQLAGVSVAGIGRLFDVGPMQKTDSAMDLAIQGEGFIEVALPDGTSGFTRGGALKVNQDGVLATQEGYALQPNISIPEDLQTLIIKPDGLVQAVTTQQKTPIDLGRLEVVKFSNPSALKAQGHGLYLATQASGKEISTKNAQGAASQLMQGYLEASNVKMVDEMVNLTIAQRSYEASAKIVQAADEMMAMINNLRR